MRSRSAWVRCSRGRLTYAGRITRAPFLAWASTPEGRAEIDKVAARIGFSLLGRSRAARRRLWRQLEAAARDEAVIAAIQSEIDVYLARLGQLAYSSGLPREGVSLHRLVVVPCVLLNGAACSGIERRLNALVPFASLEGGPALRGFFIMRLIHEIEAAVASARPSPRRPLPAGDEWITIGLNSAYAWRVPMLQEPPWDGHHYVLELTRAPVTREVRKAVVASIQRFEASLPALPRIERNEILRQAGRGL